MPLASSDKPLSKLSAPELSVPKLTVIVLDPSAACFKPSVKSTAPFTAVVISEFASVSFTNIFSIYSCDTFSFSCARIDVTIEEPTVCAIKFVEGLKYACNCAC